MPAKRYATGEELHDLFHAVFELHGALSAVMDEVHARVGLRTSQLMVTDAVLRHGTAAVPEIAAALGVSRQHVQVTCDALEQLGVIAYHDRPRHKRSKLVALTSSGRDLVARATKAEAAIIQASLPDIEAALSEKSASFLRTIAKRISESKLP